MERVTRVMAQVLMLALLALATWQSGASPRPTPPDTDPALPWWTFGLAGAVWWLTLGGAFTRRVAGSTPLSPTRANLAWLVALSLGWAVLMHLHPAFAWVAFPLFVLWLMHQPLRWAVPAVAVLTALVASAELASPDGGLGGVVGPAIGGAACVLGAWTMTRVRQESETRAALVDELRDTRAALAAAHAEAGALAERHRIARDLHDTVVQSFTSVVLLTGAVPEGPDRDPLLDRIEDVARDGLAESRRVVEALRREDGRSLTDALRQAAEAVVDPPTELVVTGTECQLPTATEVGLLRIAQGALGNVTEHAGATRATVTLTFGDDHVRLVVADDGRGGARLDAPPRTDGGATRGTGLTGARDRAADLGGTLELHSPPRGGTRLTVEVPA